MSGCDCLTHRQAELEEPIFLWTWWTRSCCRPLQLWEGKQVYLYLLSDHVGVVTGLDFEGAVVCPEVDRVGDTSNTPFIDLPLMLASGTSKPAGAAHQLRSLRSSDGKFQICIFLPVTEQQWKLC